VLTVFPEMFPGPLGQSLSGKALARALWQLTVVNLRDFATDRHQTVDDTPFGGGAGMVMRPDVVAGAVDASHPSGDARPLVYLSPRGIPLSQRLAADLASGPGLVALCGRYEGVDQRVLEARDFLEVSLGDFVLSGGELAAMCLIDACVRLLPGVVGDAASIEDESFSAGLLEYPHYTRPQVWEGRKIPEVLLSGHHAQITEWRRQQAIELTRARRPDLLTSPPRHDPWRFRPSAAAAETE
jgi:tRNA (guanine37-N1)-methyltransferase